MTTKEQMKPTFSMGQTIQTHKSRHSIHVSKQAHIVPHIPEPASTYAHTPTIIVLFLFLDIIAVQIDAWIELILGYNQTLVSI